MRRLAAPLRTAGGICPRFIVRQARQDVVRETELEIALRDRLRRHIAALNQQTGGALPIALRDRLQDKGDDACCNTTTSNERRATLRSGA
jgi:hypothetical protein